ncbi:hypothetical protein BJX61DRAFT_547957 [Aspergillus egyptiacus]|nr:hypothetical protein BJX61DRAFT_547957 [Aspergillus egyptiacus]
MKLRSVVRPPKRLEEEQSYLPASKRKLRDETEEVIRPPIIEFNPNLPPAAFPTLDFGTPTPRVDTQEETNDCQDGGGLQDGNERATKRASLDLLGLLMKNPGTQMEDPVTAEMEDIPMDVLENIIASNGDLNPLYVSNMARMAAAGDCASPGDLDMEDSDRDEEIQDSPSVTEPNRDTAWADLSPRMQVEIFDNLLQCHNLPTVYRMLGLTADERKKARDFLIRRAEQTKLEDQVLKAMRERQLKDLLKLNNSSQLVFRKTSRQALRRLREVMDTNFDFDFFYCESDELTAAKTFLRKKGIEPKFAGDWSNTIGLPPSRKEPASFESDFDGDLGPIISSIVNRQPDNRPDPSPTTLSPTPTIPTAVQEAFLTWFGDTAPETNLRFLQHSQIPDVPSRWLTLFLKNYLEPGRLRQKKRKRQVTEFRASGRDTVTVLPGNLHLQAPPLDHVYSDDLALRARQSNGVGAVQRNNTLSNLSLARTSHPQAKQDDGQAQGQRHQDTNTVRTHSATVPEPASSLPFRSRPGTGEVKNEAAERCTSEPSRREITHCSGNISGKANADFTGLVKTPRFIAVSSPQTGDAAEPSEHRQTDSDGEDLFAFSSIGTPQTVNTEASPPESASLSVMGQAALGDSSMCSAASDRGAVQTPRFSEATSELQCASDSKGAADEDEDDELEAGEEDEMVLLPTEKDSN